jgi:hypothetical protein
VYSCPSPADCNGNLYAISASNSGTLWQIVVDIKVTSSYTGTQYTDKVEALAIGSFANTFTNFSLVSNPGATAWTLQPGGLNAGGCDGNGNPFECVHSPTLSSAASLTSAGTILEWVFQLNTSSLGSADTGCTTSAGDLGCLHLKYQYVNTGGSKVGSLGSFDIDVQPGGGAVIQAVPEPVSMFLVGAGLLGVGILGKLRRA